MSIYYYLFCQDCKIKTTFTTGTGAFMVGAEKGTRHFMREHGHHNIEILDEHHDCLYESDVKEQEVTL